MQKTIKLLKHLKNVKSFNPEKDFSGPETDAAIIEAKNAEHYINEMDFTIEMFEEIQRYLKRGAVIVLPENITAESDLKEVLENADGYSWYNIDSLKSQIDDLLTANEKINPNE